MAWMSQSELQEMGFAHLGANVRISTRAAIYDPEKISISDFSRIDDFCVVSGKVTLGRNVHITVFVNLAGGEPGVTIDDFSTVSYGSHIFSQSNDYSGKFLTNSTFPEKFTQAIRRPVIIGRHVIIGAGSIVLPGVTIGDGCSFGANTTVLASTEPWGMYVGSPARFLRSRQKDLLALEAEFLDERGAEGQ